MVAWEGGSITPGEGGFLRLGNVFARVLLPILPQNDRDLLLYLLDRVEGYDNARDHTGRKVMAVPYTEMIDGRVKLNGERLDWGSGLVRRQVTESLERLKAAGVVVRGDDRRGRQGKATAVYAIEGDLDRWAFAPFFAAMSKSRLAHYAEAVLAGKLPPPHNTEEQDALVFALAGHGLHEEAEQCSWFHEITGAHRSRNETSDHLHRYPEETSAGPEVEPLMRSQPSRTNGIHHSKDTRRTDTLRSQRHEHGGDRWSPGSIVRDDSIDGDDGDGSEAREVSPRRPLLRWSPAE